MTEEDGRLPLTIAVTSSTGVLAVAVGRTAEDGIEVVVPTDRRHAEEMSPRLQEVLDRAGVTLSEVERLAIDIGPGRFTGLRVGLATVRALAFALDVPVVGMTSLAILAASIASGGAAGTGQRTPGRPVTAVIDARRAEVFQQTFIAGEPVAEPLVGPPAELASLAKGRVTGDGVDRYPEHYEAKPDLTVVPGGHPSAVAMLALAGTAPGVTGTSVTPLYLRDPDATPNIKTRRREPGPAPRTPAGQEVTGR